MSSPKSSIVGKVLLKCNPCPPSRCYVKNLVSDQVIISYEDSDLLNSLRLGHIECCRCAVEREENKKTLDIASLFEDGDRSIGRLPALELLLEFNFSIDLERIRIMHNESPFCDGIIECLRARGISLVDERYLRTKSAAN